MINMFIEAGSFRVGLVICDRPLAGIEIPIGVHAIPIIVGKAARIIIVITRARRNVARIIIDATVIEAAIVNTTVFRLVVDAIIQRVVAGIIIEIIAGIVITARSVPSRIKGWIARRVGGRIAGGIPVVAGT